MRARKLIADSHYGPDVLQALFKAFDDAWEVIATDIGYDEHAREAARLELATAILSLGSEPADTPDAIKDAALKAMAVKRGPTVAT